MKFWRVIYYSTVHSAYISEFFEIDDYKNAEEFRAKHGGQISNF
jgi:hypothetical protein